MRKIAHFGINFLLSIGLLLLFVVIHELGHTLTARLLGDPESTFYLVRIEENSTCLGCNISDYTKISPLGNLLVSLAGLTSTSLVGLGLIFLSAWGRLPLLLQRWLVRTGLAYVFLDSLVQGLQGLLYDIEKNTWPTNVDLMDFMLLLQRFTGSSQVAMKIGLLVFFILYLAAVGLLFSRISTRAARL